MYAQEKKMPEHCSDSDFLETIQVNGKPVEIHQPVLTGLEIKKAAIAAGLPIQLDFVLSWERPDGRLKIVKDADEGHWRENGSFIAVAPDDNS